MRFIAIFFCTFVLFTLSARLATAQSTPSDIKVTSGKCTDTIMFPPHLVKLLTACYETEKSDNCLSYGPTISNKCPDICKKAIVTGKPYMKKVNALYMNNRGTKNQSGWLYKFSKGESFGWLIAYATDKCLQSPPEPSCTLPICDGMLWNIM